MVVTLGKGTLSKLEYLHTCEFELYNPLKMYQCINSAIFEQILKEGWEKTGKELNKNFAKKL